MFGPVGKRVRAKRCVAFFRRVDCVFWGQAKRFGGDHSLLSFQEPRLLVERLCQTPPGTMHCTVMASWGPSLFLFLLRDCQFDVCF